MLAKVENEERSILSLQQSGCDMLKCRLNEIDITANNESEMFDKANEILMRNKELQAKTIVIQQQVSYFETVNGQLLKAYVDQPKFKRVAKGKKQIFQEKLFKESQKQNSSKLFVNVPQQESSLSVIEKAMNSNLPRLDTPSPAASKLSASSNSPNLTKNSVNMKDTFQIANANDRINSMIVAALNDGKQAQQGAVSNVRAAPVTASASVIASASALIKIEKPKRKYERKNKNLDKAKEVKEVMEQSVTSETITNVRDIKKLEQTIESKPMDISGDSTTSLSYSNCLAKSPLQEQQEDKKPLTLTLGKWSGDAMVDFWR